ncbi:MAG: hypothetical protein IJO72_04895 [Oscillospiraceae bacterium]|nr:hypothetical protein [Oscillospiraceae bacterium]MBQ9930097.1 hypothetical protein [Oscillospiraceae bacterium]
MEAIITFLEGYLPEGFQVESFLKMALFLIAGLAVFGLLGRFVFGKGSVLSNSVSSAIAILFIYVITIVIHSLGVDLKFLLSPLPFIEIDGDYLRFLIYDKSQYPLICNQLLTMIILAFVANLADSWLPKGKNIFAWFFFRCLSVIIAMVLHLIANAILAAFLPEGLLTWAPVVLLGILVLMLLVGALKLLVGLVLSTVNPVIGALYTFFFANIIGKQISKAVLTTAILAGIVVLMHYLGIAAVYIASSALVVYIPLLIILLLLWWLIGKIF